MKRKYNKPLLLIDNFSVSTNIGSSCENIIDNQTMYVCGIEYGPSMIFTIEVDSCDLRVEEWDGYCYHTPNDTNNIFNS